MAATTTNATEEEKDATAFVDRRWVARVGARDNGKFKITIMTWNILAHGLSGLHGSKSKTFADIPRKYLELNHRLPLMLAEVRKWDCDILCFQEFDLYDQREFMDGLAAQNYEMAVLQTKLWSPCLTIDPRLSADGVAIFFKSNLFSKERIETSDQEQHKRWMSGSLSKRDANASVAVSEREVIEMMGEDDGPKVVGILKREVSPGNEWTMSALNEWINTPKPPVSAGVRLIPRAAPDLPLYIMTTHLVASKKLKGEVQRHDELRDLLLDERHRAHIDRDATFLCFDMNASFEAINDYAPQAYPYLTGSAPSNASLPGMTVERSDEQFKSATRDYANGDTEMEWSSWKKRNTEDGPVNLKYGVDFVFYPTRGWQVTRVSSLPSNEEMDLVSIATKEEDGDLPAPMPSRLYPSDHLSVCCELQVL